MMSHIVSFVNTYFFYISCKTESYRHKNVFYYKIIILVELFQDVLFIFVLALYIIMTVRMSQVWTQTISRGFYVIILLFAYIHAKEDLESKVDRVIEEEITNRLSDNLFQSLEIKFYDDLSKSVNMVLMKIKVLLQNGTNHIQDGLEQLQNELEVVKQRDTEGIHLCLTKMQNNTLSLAENTLHQMILCAYALIGHDPAQAILKVVHLKKMIQDTLKPLRKQNDHINSLLRVCGHSHDTLDKVVRCVVSKSAILKSTMLEITENVIQGVVDLTKLVSHGAMHEACLIEVIKSAEDEALQIMKNAKICQSKSLGNETIVDNIINDDKVKNEVKDVKV